LRCTAFGTNLAHRRLAFLNRTGRCPVGVLRGGHPLLVPNWVVTEPCCTASSSIPARISLSPALLDKSRGILPVNPALCLNHSGLPGWWQRGPRTCSPPSRAAASGWCSRLEDGPAASHPAGGRSCAVSVLPAAAVALCERRRPIRRACCWCHRRAGLGSDFYNAKQDFEWSYAGDENRCSPPRDNSVARRFRQPMYNHAWNYGQPHSPPLVGGAAFLFIAFAFGYDPVAFSPTAPRSHERNSPLDHRTRRMAISPARTGIQQSLDQARQVIGQSPGFIFDREFSGASSGRRSID